MRVVLYTGKGGVGKTTTAAATAVCAARRGLRTLVVSADAAHSLGDVLEVALDGEARTVPGCEAGSDPASGGLDAVEVDARAEMERHWGSVRDYLISIFRYQGIEASVAEELALLPGAEEITTLMAVDGFARSRRYDLLVVDCAPTDSALRLLTLPEVARGAFRVLLRLQQAIAQTVTPLARSVLAVPLPDGDVFRDAEQLLYKKLRSLRTRVTAASTSVRLVVTPERMVIDEALRAHTDLALFELRTDAVVMNRMLPEAALGERFFADWGRVQAERLEEVESLFAPLPVLPAPIQDDEVAGIDRLAGHGEALFARHRPEAILCDAALPRFERDAVGYLAAVPLPHADPRELDVAVADDTLVVRTAERRRAFRLPRRFAGLEVASARLEGGSLEVRFEEEAPGCG